MEAKTGTNEPSISGIKVHFHTLLLAAFGIGLAVIICMIFAASAQAASMHVLRDDATGGDCTAIGSWDDVSNTCTMNTDVAVLVAGDTAIEIVDDGLTLDGAGHQVTGLGATFPPPDPGVWVPEYGVMLNTVADVEVRNLRVHDIDEGIMLNGATSSLITGNEIRDCTRGAALVFSTLNTVSGNNMSNNIFASVDLPASDDNEILDNTITSSVLWGIRIFEGDDNLISGNLISNRNSPAAGDGTAVYVYYGTNNLITSNTLSTALYGVDIDVGTGNVIVANSFISNVNQADDVGGNIFDLAAPAGGNHWDDFDEPGEGCVDVSPADGFCDSPYVFTGNQDNLPLIVCDGCPDDVAVPPLPMTISLQLDRIHLQSRGLVAVTIFGAEDFPVMDIDQDSVSFAGAVPHVRFRPRDVNRDGYDDLVMNFRVSDTNLVPGDSEACLAGNLQDGTPIEGCSPVAVR